MTGNVVTFFGYSYISHIDSRHKVFTCYWQVAIHLASGVGRGVEVRDALHFFYIVSQLKIGRVMGTSFEFADGAGRHALLELLRLREIGSP